MLSGYRNAGRILDKYQESIKQDDKGGAPESFAGCLKKGFVKGMEKKSLRILVSAVEPERLAILKEVIPRSGFAHEFLPDGTGLTEDNCQLADIVIVSRPLDTLPAELRSWCSGWLILCEPRDDGAPDTGFEQSSWLESIDDLWVGPFTSARLKFYFRRFLREEYYTWTNLMGKDDEADKYKRELEKQVALKTRTIREMQAQILVSFADLINSRDHAIADHIRNTNWYVDVLLKELQREGTKPTLADQSYCDEISQAVPLHDIGKISIPDRILNKKGSYTAEEFAVMRSHTERGGKLIERTLSRLENYRYYQIAKNMALYHHENWNGTGYPGGLKGKDIPLEARIMAVADVFDALISKRLYREARTIEQAYVIIKAGAGTQFDPEVAAAFIIARPKIEKVVREKIYHM